MKIKLNSMTRGSCVVEVLSAKEPLYHALFELQEDLFIETDSDSDTGKPTGQVSTPIRLESTGRQL